MITILYLHIDHGGVHWSTDFDYNILCQIFVIRTASLLAYNIWNSCQQDRCHLTLTLFWWSIAFV